MDTEDYGLRTLLDLHGYQFTLENGFWWKIEAYGIEKSKFRPHGIRYNLTLHNRYNHRVFGMDNAHAIEPPKKGGFPSRLVVFDHMHRTSIDPGYPYYFHSAAQLLDDFFAAVDRVVNEAEGKR